MLRPDLCLPFGLPAVSQAFALLCFALTPLEKSFLATCLPLPLPLILAHDTVSFLYSPLPLSKMVLYLFFSVPLTIMQISGGLYWLSLFPYTRSIIWDERYKMFED